MAFEFHTRNWQGSRKDQLEALDARRAHSNSISQEG